MASTPNERKILTVTPNGLASLFRTRNLVRLALAVAVLSPTVQQTVWPYINAIRMHGLTADIKKLLLFAPSILLLVDVLYSLLYQKTCVFVLTDERLIVRYGLFLRVEDEVELYRVVDVTQTIGLLQRLLGVGTVQVTSTDRTGNVVMPLIRNPAAVRNAVRTEAEKCKSRRGSVRILE